MLWAGAVALIPLLVALYLVSPRLIRAAADLGDALLEHPYFAVREIQVRAGEHVGGSEIVAMAGLSHGTSIWKIDPAAIERKVAGHPWIKRVLVRRELPGRVVIEAEERKVKAIVVLGKLYYVDPQAVIFKQVGEGDRLDFPLLTGLRRSDLQSDFSARSKIEEALRLAELMERQSLSLSQIHFGAGGVVVYPVRYPLALQMGWGNWQEKIERLARVLEVWKGKENRLAGMDLRFEDQVVTRLRKG